MSSVSQADKQRALQIEREINSQQTKNRHVAEERNQVALNAEQDADDDRRNNNDEEAKYGATDLRD